MERFSGGVFSPALSGGRAGAHLHFADHAIRAETVDGQSFVIPLADCQLSLGGASGRMWFCKDDSQSLTFFCEQRGFSHALRAADAQLSKQVHALRRARRAQGFRAVGWALLSLALAATLLVLLYDGLRSAGQAAVQALPADVDQEVGQLAVANMDLGGPLIHNPAITEPITALIARLAEHTDGRFQFHVQVVDASIVNAFALPGGEIVVYTELLRKAKSFEEVAAVLAHEISHVTLRHGIERIAHSIGVAATVQLFFGDVSGLAALAGELLQSGALTSYGRDQERDADLAGLRLLHRSGLPPDAMASIFETLQRQQPQVPAHLQWLGTHPGMAERIARVRQRARELGPAPLDPLGLDFEALGDALASPLSPSDGNASVQDAGVEPPGEQPHAEETREPHAK